MNVGQLIASDGPLPPFLNLNSGHHSIWTVLRWTDLVLRIILVVLFCLFFLSYPECGNCGTFCYDVDCRYDNSLIKYRRSFLFWKTTTERDGCLRLAKHATSDDNRSLFCSHNVPFNFHSIKPIVCQTLPDHACWMSLGHQRKKTLIHI